MNTIFEFRQIGKSWGEEDSIEIKVFEDGSLFYKVIDDHMMNCFEKSKEANKKLADDITFIIRRHKECFESIPEQLNDGSRGGYRHEVKFNDYNYFGNELNKIFTYEDSLAPNAEDEDTIIQIIGLVKKSIDSAYPDFIDWDAVSTQWFKNQKISNYKFDGEYYCIENDKRLYQLDENAKEHVVSDITVDQLKMYGECLDPWVFELRVLSIKTFEEPDWKALIIAEDGAGIEIAFWDECYFDHPELYEIGKIGVYSIWGNIQTKPKPVQQIDGVYLEKDEEAKYEQYVYGEKSVKGKSYKYINDLDFAIFEKTEDFENTGFYNFRTVVSSPYCDNDEDGKPNDKIITGFMMPLMNQVNKEYPRKVSAQFDLEHPFKGDLNYHDGLKGVISFSTSTPLSDNIGKYGSNNSIPYSEKHPDTSEWDGEEWEDVDTEDNEEV